MRRCGYCRDFGHTKDKCQMRELQRVGIAMHMYHERRTIHEMLINAGFGVGALVQVLDSDDSIGIIEEQGFSFNRGDLMSERNVKYSKQVKVTLNTFSGRNHHPESSFHLNHAQKHSVGMVATQTRNMCEKLYFCVSRPDANGQVDPADRYGWLHRCKLLVPSNDTNLTDADFDAAFIMPARLVSPGQRSFVKPSELTKL